LEKEFKDVSAGDATATVTLQVLPTNETRLMHEFILSLLSVEPANVASLKSQFSTKHFLIPDVGNPGGVFSFGSDMNSTYTVRVTTYSNFAFYVDFVATKQLHYSESCKSQYVVVHYRKFLVIFAVIQACSFTSRCSLADIPACTWLVDNMSLPYLPAKLTIS